MDLAVLVPVIIAVCGGISYLAFKRHIVFIRFKHYFLLYPFQLLIFFLGWNLSLYYAEHTDSIIEWKYVIVLTGYLIAVKIVHIVSVSAHFDDTARQW